MRVYTEEQIITKEQYEKYHKIPDISCMRTAVKDDFVPKERLNKWCGVSLHRSDNKYYLLHFYEK